MPRSDDSFLDLLTRRQMLLAAGAGTVGLMLPGCGGGGGGAKEPAPASVMGTVEPGSFAASSGLRVANAYQGTASVGSAGEFTTLASQRGVMIHVVFDAQDRVVGTALSTPGQTIRVDAESCLLASLFLTPGIVVIDPAPASQVVARLQGLPSYIDALTYLRAHLPTTIYGELLSDPAYTALVTRCVLDYTPPSRSRDITYDPDPLVADGFTVLLDQKKLSATKVSFVNYGWRFVKIDRIERDVANAVLAHREPVDTHGFKGMGGAEAASLETLFTTVGNPADAKDAPSLDLSSVATTDYWIQGPGWKKDQELPEEVGVSVLAHLLSLFYYGIWPCLQVFPGVSTDPISYLEKVTKEFERVLVDLAVYVNLIKDISPGKSEEEIRNEAIGAFKELLKALLSKKTLVDIGLLAVETNALVLAIIEIAEILLAEYNLGRAVREWVSYEQVAKLQITSNGNGGIVVR